MSPVGHPLVALVLLLLANGAFTAVGVLVDPTCTLPQLLPHVAFCVIILAAGILVAVLARCRRDIDPRITGAMLAVALLCCAATLALPDDGEVVPPHHLFPHSYTVLLAVSQLLPRKWATVLTLFAMACCLGAALIGYGLTVNFFHEVKYFVVFCAAVVMTVNRRDEGVQLVYHHHTHQQEDSASSASTPKAQGLMDNSVVPGAMRFRSDAFPTLPTLGDEEDQGDSVVVLNEGSMNLFENVLRIMDKLSEELELLPAQKFIIDNVCDLLSCERATLFYVDNENNELWARVATDEAEIRIPMDRGFAGYCAAHNTILNIPNAYEDKRFNPDVDLTTGYRTRNVLVFPISSKNNLIGVIQAINKKGGKSFTQQDESILSLMAKQAGNHIQNSQIYEKLSSSQRTLAKLLDVSKDLSSDVTLDVGKMLGRVMTRAMDILHSERTSVFLVDRKAGELWSLVTNTARIIRVPLGKGIAGQVAMQGKIVNIQDAYSHDHFHPEIDKKTGYTTRSMLCAPIFNNSEILGVVQLINKKDRPCFDREDERMVETFASFVGITITNAKLYQRLKSQGERQELMLRMSKGLAATMNVVEMILLLQQETAKIMNVEACSVYLFRKSDRTMQTYRNDGVGVAFPIGGVAGYVGQKKRAVRINDLRKNNIFKEKVDNPHGLKHLLSMIVTPILNGENVLIGVLQVMNKKKKVKNYYKIHSEGGDVEERTEETALDTFADSDVELLAAVSTNAGVSIHTQVQVDMQVEEEKEKTKALIDASTSLSSFVGKSQSSQSSQYAVLQNLMEAARKSIRADYSNVYMVEPKSDKLVRQTSSGDVVPPDDHIVHKARIAKDMQKTRLAVALPLIAHNTNQVWGVVEVGRYDSSMVEIGEAYIPSEEFSDDLSKSASEMTAASDLETFSFLDPNKKRSTRTRSNSGAVNQYPIHGLRQEYDYETLLQSMLESEKRSAADGEAIIQGHPSLTAVSDFTVPSSIGSLTHRKPLRAQSRLTMDASIDSCTTTTTAVSSNDPDETPRSYGGTLKKTARGNCQFHDEDLKLLDAFCAHSCITIENSRRFQEMQERNDELQRLRDAAQLAAEAKASFLMSMSHEIRTPMSVVIGMTELLMPTGLSSEQKEMVANIHSCGEALLAIINDILDYGRLGNGKLQFERRRFNVRSLLEETVDVIVGKAQEQNVEVCLEIAPTLPANLVGDAYRLRQVITNLLSNSTKFTTEGHIMLKVTEEALDAHSGSSSELQHTSSSLTDGTATGTDLTMTKCRLRFEVSDTGIGIAQSKQVNLFQPFSQADSTTTRKYGGSGLGLAICKHIINNMDGEIGMASEEGKGCTIWCTAVFLKFGEDTVTTLGWKDRAKKDTTAVIVMQHEPQIKVLKAYLKMAGVSVAYVDTQGAQHYLSHLEEGSDVTNCMLLDERSLPIDTNLEDFLREVEKKQSPLPHVLFLTRMSIKSRIHRRAGLSVLTKPVKMRALFQALRTIGEDPEVTERRRTLQESASIAQINTQQIELLVAEDTPINQQLITQQLGRIGYKCRVCDNGVKVMQTLAETHYPLIIMDCHMPEMDGYETSAEIRRCEKEDRWPDYPPIIIIALTADAIHGTREKCLESGMDDYITKPVRKGDLERILNKHLRV